MSKTPVTVFLCTGKDCTRAWRRICNGSPRKWLRRRVEEAGLPYRLEVIKTECMDRCANAANLCCVHGPCADFVAEVRAPDDADRILAALRSCVESAPVAPARTAGA